MAGDHGKACLQWVCGPPWPYANENLGGTQRMPGEGRGCPKGMQQMQNEQCVDLREDVVNPKHVQIFSS